MSVPRKKTLCVETTPRFYIDGVAIPQIGPEDQFKYLGHHYGYMRILQTDIPQLKLHLQKVTKAALKPLQKIVLIKEYIIPKILFMLQSLSIYKTVLDAIDKQIHFAAKNILRLPHSTPNGVLYATVRGGGFGLPCLADSIPASILRRTHAIFLAGDSVALRALQSPWSIHQLERLAGLANHGIANTDIANH